MTISRRDFLNGCSLAIAAGIISCHRLENILFTEHEYPPLLQGIRGNHPGSFENAHAVGREGKNFSTQQLAVEESYDLVVVGAGISGLSAAYYYQKKHPQARILILDNHDDFGGHAKRNEFNSENQMVLGYGGSESLDAPKYRFSTTALNLIKEIGIDIDQLKKNNDQDFFYHLNLKRAAFFDKENFGQDKLAVGSPFVNPTNDPLDPQHLNGRSIHEYVNDFPLSENDKKAIIELYTKGKNYLPNKSIQERVAYLKKTSYWDFLQKDVGLSEQALKYFYALTHDDNAIGIDAVPAWDARESFFLPGFIAMELPPPEEKENKILNDPYVYHFPDGNASIARLLVSHLIPEVSGGKKDMNSIVLSKFNYSKLDKKNNLVRLRLSSVVVSVKNTSHSTVDIGYLDKPKLNSDGTLSALGNLHRIEAKHVVMAGYNMMIPHIVKDLPKEQQSALAANVKAPIVFTKVLLSNWMSFKNLGVHEIYSPCMPYSTVKLDYVTNIGGYKHTSNPNKPAALQMIHVPTWPNSGMDARQQWRSGRYKLLSKSFYSFEQEIRDQLQRILGPGGFNHKKDILGITVNRWSHGFSYSFNSLFDNEDEAEETIKTARKPFGNIVIANSDSAWNAYFNSAIDMAYRAINELDSSSTLQKG